MGVNLFLSDPPSSYLGNGLMAARLAALGALRAEGNGAALRGGAESLAGRPELMVARLCFGLLQLWSGGFSKVPACQRNSGTSGASGV